MTGMTANKSGTMTSNIVLKGSHALTAGLSSVAPSFLTNPSWSITNATVLGQSEGLNTLAVKENNGWKSVYMGAAKPDRAFLRNLAKFAGANVFMTSGDTFFGNDNLVVVHTQKNASGTRKVTFPSNATCTIISAASGIPASRPSICRWRARRPTTCSMATRRS